MRLSSKKVSWVSYVSRSLNNLTDTFSIYIWNQYNDNTSNCLINISLSVEPNTCIIRRLASSIGYDLGRPYHIPLLLGALFHDTIVVQVHHHWCNILLWGVAHQVTIHLHADIEVLKLLLLLACKIVYSWKFRYN